MSDAICEGSTVCGIFTKMVVVVLRNRRDGRPDAVGIDAPVALRTDLPVRHARIEKHSASSTQLVPHPDNGNIDLKTGRVPRRVHDVCDGLEHSLNDGVEVPTPNRFLPEVCVLLQISARPRNLRPSRQRCVHLL